MDKGAKVYVAGHRGLAGSAIVRELQRQGYTACFQFRMTSYARNKFFRNRERAENWYEVFYSLSDV